MNRASVDKAGFHAIGSESTQGTNIQGWQGAAKWLLISDKRVRQSVQHHMSWQD
ncbi:MAG: hypothetical protein K6T78_13005 [Alicyclobacillus sp.]|nr:hypothetical protein [Alicyclobacillus sp.]